MQRHDNVRSTKSFDTVDHAILFGKLKLMGIPNTDWFMSYLLEIGNKLLVLIIFYQIICL
jgi:hypothetical protein